jgi:hypothetical protein
VEDETLVDLSHLIEPGMTTYKGLPGPAICDFWSRADSAAFYDDGETFQIGRIDMVANTGTYLDTPFHRLEDGADLAGIALDQVAALDGMVIRKPHAGGLAIDAGDLGASTFAARRCCSTPAGTNIGAASLISRTTRSSPPQPPKRLPEAARPWSASTVTILTTRGPAPARSTRSCSARAC